MANILTAIMITLDDAHEGGFQNNPKDRANWTSGIVGVGTLVGTNGGITALDMPGADIKNLTIAQKVAYYTEHYVKPTYSQIVSQEVLNKLFDMGVLFGIGEAAYLLQRALNFPPAQWTEVFDASTLLATNAVNSSELLLAYRNHLHAHAANIAAANPNDAPDLPDWSRRINS